ncbi:hypothetical protein L596_015646 [Steinernema carpocapsae]|uniref:Uncharacterized protein n=1 Tax=Steinernema carpocapsae TaxID=34508 RepID=A0A4U5NG84_STECR|nr:hypothetical protein L596_015646 [Steinernema carpocapsae]
MWISKMKKAALVGVLVLCAVLAIAWGAVYRDQATENVNFDDGQVIFQVQDGPIRPNVFGKAKKKVGGEEIDAKSGQEFEKVTSGFGGFGKQKLLEEKVVILELPIKRTTMDSQIVYQSEDGNTLRIKGKNFDTFSKSQSSTPSPMDSEPVVKRHTINEEKSPVYEKVGEPKVLEIPADDEDKETSNSQPAPAEIPAQLPAKKPLNDDSFEVNLPSGIYDIEVKRGKPTEPKLRKKRGKDGCWI